MERSFTNKKLNDSTNSNDDSLKGNFLHTSWDSKEENSIELNEFSKSETEEMNKSLEFLKISPQEEEEKKIAQSKELNPEKYSFDSNPFLAIFYEFLRGEDNNISLTCSLLENLEDFVSEEDEFYEITRYYNHLIYLLGLKVSCRRDEESTSFTPLCSALLEKLSLIANEFMTKEYQVCLIWKNESWFFHEMDLSRHYEIAKRNSLHVAQQIVMSELFNNLFKTYITKKF